MLREDAREIGGIDRFGLNLEAARQGETSPKIGCHQGFMETGRYRLERHVCSFAYPAATRTQVSSGSLRSPRRLACLLATPVESAAAVHMSRSPDDRFNTTGTDWIGLNRIAL